MAALGGPIYAIGGLDDNSCFNDVERYDIESDCWSAVAPMNTPRGGVGSVALGVRPGRSAPSQRSSSRTCECDTAHPRLPSSRTLYTQSEATTGWRRFPAWSASIRT